MKRSTQLAQEHIAYRNMLTSGKDEHGDKITVNWGLAFETFNTQLRDIGKAVVKEVEEETQ